MSGAASASKVVFGTLVAFPLAFAAFEVEHLVCEHLGLAKHEPTLEGKWKEAEKIRLLNMEREGAPDEPILMNPFRRGLPASVRNAEQLAEYGTK